MTQTTNFRTDVKELGQNEAITLIIYIKDNCQVAAETEGKRTFEDLLKMLLAEYKIEWNTHFFIYKINCGNIDEAVMFKEMAAKYS